MKITNHHCLSKAETNLSHQADEKMETTALFRYENAVGKNGDNIKVYNISAGSFRSTLRRAGAYQLCDLLGLKPEELPELSHVVLFSGGPRLESSETIKPLNSERALRQLFPLLDLFGGTVSYTMLESQFKTTQLTAINKTIYNNFDLEKEILDCFKINVNELPESVVDFEYNTKKDSRVKYDNESSKEGCDCGTVANIFDIQIIKKGTWLANKVILNDYDDNLLSSCLNSCIQYWQNSGGLIGGKTSQGHGHVSFNLQPILAETSIYIDYINNLKDQIKKAIMDKQIWKDKKAILNHLK